ncbi:MAG TPA: molecular chaperone HtpG [Candidatus Limnocylindria bacterium]|nr:molecular chaperone HtpG [Candidatus Limnocylindria bacterium]
MSTVERRPFQAEIQQLLDIVIHSLYTDREVFVRELVSNAADACEKLRFLQSSGEGTVFESEKALGITVVPDEEAATLTIADTGVGMTEAELVENLGTIAHSGTKAFLKQLADNQKPDTRLIGQFGVGFYSAFMAAKKVTVFTRSFREGESGWKWTSDGAGGYEIEPATDVPRGTKIVLELKDDAKDFLKEGTLERVIKRYSNFVTFPIELGGKRLNTVQAIWARSKNDVKDEEYNEFYKYIGHDSDEPLYRLHFTADAPLSIQALLFVPQRSFEAIGLVRQESEVHLYCKKVLIEPKAKGLLPEWLRFVKGVVDSEDLPLNVSRERMQDSELMKKLSRALTNRFLKFLNDEAEKNAEQYDKFYKEHHRFLKEGVLSDWDHREALGKLLRFQSSTTESGKMTSLAEYVKRMPSDQTEIYYLAAANRDAAETSPYFEVFKSRSYEVLFLDDPAEEFVLERLSSFDNKSLTAAEKANLTVVQPPAKEGELTEEQSKSLSEWLKEKLAGSVHDVRSSNRLVDSPAVAIESDSMMTATMRRTLRAVNKDKGGMDNEPPDFEFNPRHPMIVKLEGLRQKNSDLAVQIAEQVLDNARISAGMLEDPRAMLKRINGLLEQLLNKE